MMLICLSLLKYGYPSFKLFILEYCDKEDLILREQYYFDLLEPKYNVCKTAGSTLGKMHTEEAKKKIGLYKKGKKGNKHSEETKLKISESMKAISKGKNHSMFGKTYSEFTKRKIRQAMLGKITQVLVKLLPQSTKLRSQLLN
jgi:group I intron endonuclease